MKSKSNFSCGNIVLLFLLGIGLFTLVFSIRSNQKASQSTDWPSVVGVITHTYIEEDESFDSDGDTTTTYSPVINYEYIVDDQVYTGDRIYYGLTMKYNRHQEAAKALQAYPTNSEVEIYYNPADPSEAVLDRQAEGTTLGIMIGGGLVLLSAVSLVGLIVKRRSLVAQVPEAPAQGE